MKALGLGINRSKRAKGVNWHTDSEPDPTVNRVFSNIFDEYKLDDVINDTYTNKKYNSLTKNEKMGLCEKNKPRLLNLIHEFRPQIIILFTVSKKIPTLLKIICLLIL